MSDPRRLAWIAPRSIVTGLTLFLAAGCTSLSPGGRDPGIAGHAFEDAEVTRIHTRMVETMAPNRGWERTRYLEFDWAVARADGGPPAIRSHRWDRWEGLARVENTLQDGRSLVAIFPTEAPETGSVWINGIAVTDVEERETRLRSAYSTHINDSYWLIMPYKWTDPGVTVRYLGVEEELESGVRWEKVELSFEEVGLTPQNVYRAWINSETGLMERWEHFRSAEASPSPMNWEEWTGTGPLTLARNRSWNGQLRIYFPHMVAAEAVPPGAFDAPAPSTEPESEAEAGDDPEG
jgi:hypothetical protein